MNFLKKQWDILKHIKMWSFFFIFNGFLQISLNLREYVWLALHTLTDCGSAHKTFLFIREDSNSTKLLKQKYNNTENLLYLHSLFKQTHELMKEFFQIPRETIKLESSNFYSRMILNCILWTSRCLCKGLSNLQKECKNHQNKPIFNLYYCVFDLSLEICINHDHSCQQHLKCLIYRRSLNVSNEYFMCRNNN